MSYHQVGEVVLVKLPIFFKHNVHVGHLDGGAPLVSLNRDSYRSDGHYYRISSYHNGVYYLRPIGDSPETNHLYLAEWLIPAKINYKYKDAVNTVLTTEPTPIDIDDILFHFNANKVSWRTSEDSMKKPVTNKQSSEATFFYKCGSKFIAKRIKSFEVGHNEVRYTYTRVVDGFLNQEIKCAIPIAELSAVCYNQVCGTVLLRRFDNKVKADVYHKEGIDVKTV